MRTSLTEVREIDDWLLKDNHAEGLVTEAKMVLSPEFRDIAMWQKEAHNLVKLYGREKLKSEIHAIEKELFSLPKYRSFQERIRSIFKK